MSISSGQQVSIRETEAGVPSGTIGEVVGVKKDGRVVVLFKGPVFVTVDVGMVVPVSRVQAAEAQQGGSGGSAAQPHEDLSGLSATERSQVCCDSNCLVYFVICFQ
jgi:hypothetical protein